MISLYYATIEQGMKVNKQTIRKSIIMFLHNFVPINVLSVKCRCKLQALTAVRSQYEMKLFNDTTYNKDQIRLVLEVIREISTNIKTELDFEEEKLFQKQHELEQKQSRNLINMPKY